MGENDLARPPRWADALLRMCLRPQDAETQSGDLLEAYRDSILPDRERRRADLWFVQQTAGYILRAKGMTLRNWLVAGLALCALTIAFTVLRYPGLFNGWVAPVSAGFLFYAYVAVIHSHPATAEATTVLRLGSTYGIAVGLLMMGGNLFLNFGVGTGWLPVICALLLPFVAGAHAGVKIWRVSAGIRVGFWSGLISGLIMFLGLMAYGYILAFIPGIPGAEFPKNQPYTAIEYQIANVGDTLGGGLFFLFFGCVLSVIAGAVGGLAGLLLARTGRGPGEIRRILW